MMCHLYLLNVSPSWIKLIEINQQHSEENKSWKNFLRGMMDSWTHSLHLMLGNKTCSYIYMKWSASTYTWSHPRHLIARETFFFLLFSNRIYRETWTNCARIGLIPSMQYPQGADCNIYPSTCMKINIQERKSICLCLHLININPG